MTALILKSLLAFAWAGYTEVRCTRGALRWWDKAFLIGGSVAVLSLLLHGVKS
jgi:hypothetical protein